MKEPNPNGKDSIALDDADISDVEELIELVNTTTAESAELRDRIAKVEEDMILPSTVQRVLEEYGLPPEKAAEIVETVEDVEAELRGDADE